MNSQKRQLEAQIQQIIEDINRKTGYSYILEDVAFTDELRSDARIQPLYERLAQIELATAAEPVPSYNYYQTRRRAGSRKSKRRSRKTRRR